MIDISDDIEQVVIAMRSDPKVVALFNNPDINGLYPFFKPGHRLEIATSLTEKDKDPVYKLQKYPLIALKYDTTEDNAGSLLTAFDLNIAIITYTQENYSLEERKANVFKPVLYPLYESFLRNFKKVGLFYWSSHNLKTPPHNKIDRPFYGTESRESNVKLLFQDPIDAIELTNLKFSKRDKNC